MNNIDLNYYDYFNLFVVIISAIFALRKGFLSSLLSLVRLILSGILAVSYSDFLESLVAKFIANKAIIEHSCFIIAYILFYIILTIINHYIIKLFNPVANGIIDKLFGSFFGLLRGMTIVVVIFFVICSTSGSIQASEQTIRFKYDNDLSYSWIKNSYLEPKLFLYSKMLIGALPNSTWLNIKDVLLENEEL